MSSITSDTGGVGPPAASIGSPSTSASSSLTSSSRPNVSVTNINCPGTTIQNHNIPSNQLPKLIMAPSHIFASSHPPSSNSNHQPSLETTATGAVRITVPKMEQIDDDEEFESELTQIVNMRATAKANGTAAASAPRPMSWEGELSDADDGMEGDQPSPSIHGIHQPTDSPSIFHPQSHQKPPPAWIDAHQQSTEPENLTATATVVTPKRQLHSFEAIHIKDETGVVPDSPPTTTSVKTTSPPLHHPPSTTSILAATSKHNLQPANPSPDSAIHSVYTHSSPSQSPLTSRHAPYSTSLSRNNSDASHSSCYSYSSEFSPTHSPIQGRHHMFPNYNGSPLHHSVLYRPMLDASNNGAGGLVGGNGLGGGGGATQAQEDGNLDGDSLPSSTGISRQQLINSPCPICGDKISGFHYGIFSCESCKGFFKRTVQNRKNYMCLRGASCPVTITTRKKCPACRFDKCLLRGMKLEAIREDRTRGGRSTYQCGYSLPNSMLSPPIVAGDGPMSLGTYRSTTTGATGGGGGQAAGQAQFKMDQEDGSNSSSAVSTGQRPGVPVLLQEIMDVEHLWQYNDAELTRLNQPPRPSNATSSSSSTSAAQQVVSNPLLAGLGGVAGDNANPDMIAILCNVADHRLYKIVKWCKSLPLFKHISIDDQICLLINSWCELLLFSCCFRSITTPGEIRISLGKSITLEQAKVNGLQACIERMLNLTDHLRRLRVDKFEYVAMKVIVLLQSDTSELKEPEKVRASQEKALQALQEYTLAHYPDSPAKFGELLLRIPELQRTCQVGKEMLTIKSKDGEDFNLLMELLRGEH